MDYTFSFQCLANIRPVSYWGSDTLDESAPEYTALDCGNDLIDKFKEYYELGYKREIPRPHLFVINNSDVNAFAVYEKELSDYSHILNGHVDKDGEGHFEFADEAFSEDESLFQQMKEFDADETAMNILCYMARSSSESGYRSRVIGSIRH